ncbi:MAG TPA: S-layer homology domain-containing protein [Anaerolineales bacterium]|nr:S-layer homology domain-containing protein [Anaerolineales bacterium]
MLNEGGGTLTIINSTFSGNFSNGGGGGGVYNVGTLTIINSTFNSNQVGNTSGGSDGGGVYNHSFGTLTITNSTFNNNYVLNTGGGVFNAGVATIKNTIIANSTNGDCYGTLTSANNNLIEGNGHACGLTDGVNGNIIGSDPNLGSLTGSPGYFPLNPGSLAIDAGDDAACAAAPVNNQSQNGVTRPQGAHCDIGSYEAADTTAPTVSSIVRQLPADQVVTSGSSVTFRVTFSEGVSGVDTSDFTLTLLSVPGTNASISGVTPLSASVYDVTVDISGLRNSKNKLDGALRLDVSASASITDLASNALSGLPFTGGQVYSIVQEQTFSDVATSHWAWTYIERLFYMGITGGCTTSNYCPNNVVTRAQTAIFLLRGIHGASYTPPSASGTIFNDVTTSTPGAAWIEQLYAEGITSGCGGGKYCPSAAVTRVEMAVFLVRTFNLP